MLRRLALWAGRIMLSRRLEKHLPAAAFRVMTALADAGHEVNLVGGCVRDLLLGELPKDWDIVTSAGPDQILALFPHGRQMGASRGGNTVLVPVAGEPFEVTPYRGSHGLVGDLAMRDFTFNAMALGLDASLHDPMNGRADLALGVVRTCGNPRDRIAEDPLRMLRSVRFAAAFGFELDPSLTATVAEMAPLLAEVATERMGAELARLLVTDRSAWAMERLREMGLLAVFAPELLEMVGVEQNRYHAYTVWEHALIALAVAPPDLPVRLAALLHDVGKPRCVSLDDAGERHFYRHELVGAEMVNKLLRRLRFASEVRQRVVHLVRYHMDMHFDQNVSDAALRRMVRRIGLEPMHDLIQLRRADRLASGTREGDLSQETVSLLQRLDALLKADAALKVSDLAVSGHDVIAVFGRPAGPYVGDVLEQLLQEVLDDPSLNNREYLLGRLACLSAV